MPEPDVPQTVKAGEALLGLSAEMAPFYDFADGIRADLSRRGWSDTAAEQAATTWLCYAIAHMWKPT